MPGSHDAKIKQLSESAAEEFPDLSEAERKLLRAVVLGELAYCGPSDDDTHPHNNPDFADFWGLERDIRAGLIRWLCVNRNAAEWVAPRGIQVHAARINGDLELSFMSPNFPLLLLKCRLAGEMILQYAQLDALNLQGCVVGRISGDGLRVRGSVNLRRGFRAEGEVSLPGAQIGGNLDCWDGKFVNPGGYALVADAMRVTGDVRLRDGFSAEGEVRLPGAEVGGNLDCNGGRFVRPGGNAFVADGARVTGDVYLRDGFSAEGEVRLPGAEVGGDVDCSKGHFVNPQGLALNADRVKVNGSVDFRNGFSAEGEVRLLSAQIGGDVSCSGAKFTKTEGHALSVFERMTAKGGFFWRGINGERVALNLRDASVGPLMDDAGSWPDQGKLDIEGFIYSRFTAGPTDAKSRLKWLDRQAKGKFIPQPYQQLAKVLREDGDIAGANRVLIGMENRRRKFGKLARLSWVWQWVLRATIGYGYRPWYALLWAAGIVLLGFLIFQRGYHEGFITPSDKDAYTAFEAHNPKLHHGDPPAYYSEFSPVMYSLDNFLPIINFGEKDEWRPNPHDGVLGEYVRIYLWIHIALGWLLTTLFVAGLTPLVRNR